MNRGPAHTLPFSALWLVLDLIGMAMLVAGVLGLTGRGAHLAPQLAEPQVGWALVGAGAALAGFAAFNIVRGLRGRGGSR
jgi:hypothetical protein